MATIIRQFTVSIPASTAKAAPFTKVISFPAETVITLDLEVPHGPVGLMGFYLAISGQQIIPFQTGEFIVWDDVQDTWALEDYPQTNAWSIVGYNLDTTFAHQVVARFHNEPLHVQPIASIVNINLTSSAPDEQMVALS